MEIDNKDVVCTTKVSRRQFIAAVSAAGASLMAIGANATAGNSQKNTEENAYSLESLRRQIGSTFQLQIAGGHVSAKLDRIDEVKLSPELQQFTAVFRLTGNVRDGLIQDVYQLQHDRLGNMNLLLLPSETDSARFMAASFCHLQA